MKQRILIVMTGVVLVAALGGLSASAQDKFKLKPGAKGKVCLTCHATFQEKLKRAQVHTPVKKGECSGCHNPHTSSHDKLLDASTKKICSRCHNVVPEKAASVHRVVGEGTCTVCHDPHASDNPSVLLQRGDKLCYGCHGKIEQVVKQSRFKHVPVMQGCLTCHSPHASKNAASLLKEPVPALCVRCHKPASPLFLRQHMGYPVAESSCTSCHDPHGSDKKGILYDNVHKPVAGKMCNQCHAEAGSPKPFALKKEGGELCRSCHSKLFNEASLRSRIHWPVLSKEACLSCHNPHASSERGLLKGPLVQLCGSCHADTTSRMTKLKSQHAPVKDGFCMVCHQPHAADRTFLLNDRTIELCGKCHDWQTHVSHPMGEKVTDRRNRNLKVQCLSCHNAHGTDYKHMLLQTTVSEMCTQCHVEYRR